MSITMAIPAKRAWLAFTAVLSVGLMAPSAPARAATSAPLLDAPTVQSPTPAGAQGNVILAPLLGSSHLDAAAAMQGSGSDIAVWPGDGHGTFGQPTLLQSPFPAVLIHSCDVNGDGLQDIVATGELYASSSTTGMETYLNLGNGTFSSPVVTSTQNTPVDFVTVDLNHDGHCDVLALNGTSVSAFLGTVAGTFTAGPVTSLPGFATAIGAGDVNGDGKADLALLGDSTDSATASPMYLLLGQGGGSFASATTMTLGIQTSAGEGAVSIGDLNGDGVPDILAAADAVGTQRGAMEVLAGRGGGTFNQAVRTDLGIPDPAYAYIRDVDGDGRADVLVGNNASVTIMRGQGDGTFLESGFADVYVASHAAVALGDIESLGRPDVVFVASGGVIALHNQAGSYPGQWSLICNNGESYAACTTGLAANLTGTGNVDLVTLGTQYAHGGQCVLTTVEVSLGDGAGGFTDTQHFNTSCLSSPVLADLNHDGRPDLVAVGGSGIDVMLTNADGTLEQPVGYTLPGSGYAVAVGDVTGDGRPDLVVTGGSSNNLMILPGNGDGSFGAALAALPDPCLNTASSVGQIAMGRYSSGTAPQAAVLLGDTTDSNQHVAVLSFNAGPTGVVALAPIDCTGPSAPPDLSAGPWTAADITGDGYTDLVMAGDALHVWTSDGSGGFVDRSFSPPGVGWGSRVGEQTVEAADLNGDGKLDVMAGNAVFVGNGDGTFVDPGTRYFTGSDPTWAALAPLSSSDATPALIDGEPNEIVVYRPMTEPTSTVPDITTPGPALLGVSLASAAVLMLAQSRRRRQILVDHVCHKMR